MAAWQARGERSWRTARLARVRPVRECHGRRSGAQGGAQAGRAVRFGGVRWSIVPLLCQEQTTLANGAPRHQTTLPPRTRTENFCVRPYPRAGARRILRRARGPGVAGACLPAPRANPCVLRPDAAPPSVPRRRVQESTRTPPHRANAARRQLWIPASPDRSASQTVEPWQQRHSTPQRAGGRSARGQARTSRRPRRTGWSRCAARPSRTG